jgi:hypothetical protein
LLRIFHPFTLLTLGYLAYLIYHAHILYSDDKDSEIIKTDGLIIQHIITIVIVLLLVIIDVYLKIQRLNYSTFNIDAKIQKVIENFDPENPGKTIF